MSRVIHEFTTTVPTWRPFVTPIDFANATSEQREALKDTPSSQKISDYVLVLAHDPESLTHRTPLFNGIMYGEAGLPRAERELSATGTSIVNRCIYCTAVHASRFVSLTKRQDVIDAIFAGGVDAELEERQQAIFDYSVKLSYAPPEVTADDVAALTNVGLDTLDIVDVVLSAAIFGWANRLMHTLGEPVAKD